MSNDLDVGVLVNLCDVDFGAAPKPKLLLENDSFKMMRLVLPAGKEIPEHKAPKEIVVQCVLGNVDFTTMGETHSMRPASMLHLTANELHALKANEDSVMLVTMAK